MTYLGGSHFSKDIIFVVSDGEAEGLQAWLKAYHGNEENTYGRHFLKICSYGTGIVTGRMFLTRSLFYLCLERKEEPLRVRSGAIQAALNLDFAGTGDYNALGIFFGMRLFYCTVFSQWLRDNLVRIS